MKTLIDPLSSTTTPPASAPRSPAEQQRIGKALEQLSPQEASSAAPSREELVKAVQQVDAVLRPYGLVFELHEATGKMVTRLIERETGEEIKSYPSEAVLALAERLPEIQGLLVEVKI